MMGDWDCAEPLNSWRNGAMWPINPTGNPRVAYISGPMRGYPKYNFPEFFNAEEKLLAAGFRTINPARVDEACPIQDLSDPNAADAIDVLDRYIARDVAAIQSLRPGTDVIVVLDGWAASRGASAEVAVAQWRGVEVWDLATALARTGAATLDEAFAYRQTPGYPTVPPLPQADGAHEPNLLTNDDFVTWPSGDAGPKWARYGGEVRVTDPQTGGQKGSKPVRFDLIPAAFSAKVDFLMEGYNSIPGLIRTHLGRFWFDDSSLYRLIEAAAGATQALGGAVAAYHAIATVYGRGAQKYDDNNWRKGYKWSLSYAAALRHLDAIERGEFMDAEMGVPHYANVWWHCATLWTFATEGLGTDDRPKAKEAA